VWTFCGQGGKEGQFFAILCERPLWKPPNSKRKVATTLRAVK